MISAIIKKTQGVLEIARALRFALNEASIKLRPESDL